MKEFDYKLLKRLYIPPADSHKGQNGKLLLIGGSRLFHASTLWALEIASKIVDTVFFASVPENNQIVQNAKEQFRNGIVIPQIEIEHYIKEADAILIGPGMNRSELGTKDLELRTYNLKDVLQIEDEGEKTYWLTKYLLEKYPEKKWIIDAGALQMMEPEWLLPLSGDVILTPHHKEFEKLEAKSNKQEAISSQLISYRLSLIAKEYNCVVLLKGEVDIVSSPNECVEITGGNAGMTKGGTGDVLAGLVAALACKNDLFLSACAGSYINKKAGGSLFEKVGYYFNATDLVNEIPRVMKEILFDFKV